jgi:uncharacterized glyoxalase superfamily protein PhnB
MAARCSSWPGSPSGRRLRSTDELARFTGVSFHYLVTSKEIVDEVIADAVAGGGEVVKPAAGGKWGGYAGYFADPDGYLWKVATDA